MTEWTLWKVVGVVLLMQVIFATYSSGSVLTYLKGSEFKEVCIEGGRPVVLSYTRLNESAEIYCLYQDARKNSKMLLANKKGTWTVLTRTVVGGGWYWPFWL